ncbi:septum formation initiator family protein [bacterium]|nr:septum formation initiator family protein [bacterium]
MVRLRKRSLKFEKPNRIKKRYYSFLTIVLLLCIGITIKSTFENILKIVSYQGKIKEMKKIQIETAQKNENLKKQLGDLDARSYEAIARNNLKMSGEDEVLIIIHEPEEKTPKKEQKSKNKDKKKD